VADPPAEHKRNAIAHETSVDVTGARPGGDSGKRELFSESTTSVLVFENGGVIRLAADVDQGQLLFLTHRESKREVVAQVTRKRPFPTGNPYIELEFTDSAPGFWGVEIPVVAQKAEARTTPTPTLAAALMQIVEEVGEEPAVVAPAPNVEEVERLRQEVEALREQLQSMKQSASAEANETEAAPVRSSVPKIRLQEAGHAQPRVEAPNASPAATEATREESADSELAAFAAQDLFPPVALDFAKADRVIARAAHGKAQSRGTSSGGTLRLALLGAGLVVAIAGGAWYEGWLPVPLLGQASAVSSGTRVATALRTPTAAAVPAGRPQAGAIRPDSGGKIAANTAGATKGANSAGMPQNPGPGVVAESGIAAEAEPESSRELAGSSVSENTASSAIVTTRPNDRAAKEAETTEVSMSGKEGVTGPPRLVESVKAVPPRGFVTGNVVLDAVVDASGHVKSMKVVSGPQSLRSAAIDALKKYRYAPAMHNGKAVSGHVQETVQFWYEP
jgi:hypothetical protein